jgi:hypothetical protein
MLGILFAPRPNDFFPMAAVGRIAMSVPVTFLRLRHWLTALRRPAFPLNLLK